MLAATHATVTVVLLISLHVYLQVQECKGAAAEFHSRDWRMAGV